MFRRWRQEENRDLLTSQSIPISEHQAKLRALLKNVHVFLRMTYGVALGPFAHTHIKEYTICTPHRHITIKRGKIFSLLNAS